ncbi:hypothetical protein ID866_10024 [Astraeus odoratus]|nr:hypothetical protein ID866_10024 [Astraeus odoratus]
MVRGIQNADADRHHPLHLCVPLAPPYVAQLLQPAPPARPRDHPVLAQHPHRHLPDRLSTVPDTPAPPLVRAAPADTPAHAALDPAAPVTFDLISVQTHGLGVPMRKLAVLLGGALERMLVGATNHVDTGMRKTLGLQRVLLVISPGYEHLECSAPIDLFTSLGPLTHGQLAAQLALAFQSFIVKSSTHAPPSNAGSWCIAVGGANPASTTGISFDRLVLFALCNVCDNIWMAEVFVDRR